MTFGRYARSERWLHACSVYNTASCCARALALTLTRFGSASSAFGRLFTDALASSSLSSSRIAAALALSSSGDGGIGIPEDNAVRVVRCCEAMPGNVTKEQVFVSHSVDHTTQATLMVAAEQTRGPRRAEDDCVAAVREAETCGVINSGGTRNRGMTDELR